MARLVQSSLTGALLALAMGGAALSADLDERIEGLKPAVDGVNGKISAAWQYFGGAGGGSINLAYLDASLSVPVGQRFGVQLDAAALVRSGLWFGGVGAHAFWRDPDKGLAGIYGDVLGVSFSPTKVWRVGLEGEAYMGKVSVEAFAGIQGATNGAPTIFTGDLTAAFYPTENIRLSAGIARSLGVNFGKAGLEVAIPRGSTVLPALFVDSEFNADFRAVRAGLRLYFGGSDKSLIRRHREDDPRNRIGAFPVYFNDGGGSDGPPEA